MISATLADFILTLQFDRLPPNAVRLARLSFLDWLGSTARGGLEEPARIALSVVRAQGGSPQAVLIPSGERTSALNAALANGIASHIVELDDVHRGSIIHAGAAVIPAALAAAQMVHADGRRLIEAIVAGYETAIRIGEAVSPSHYYYWHNTGTCGAFGACAASAKLLGLNRDQTIWALGSAGTQAAGLWEFLESGAMSKHLHPAKAAYNGLLSALLAKEGFTGAPAIIEGNKGFCRAMAPQYNLAKITDGLGTPPCKIEDNSFKIHASCRHTHPGIDLALELAARHNLDHHDISRLTIGTYKVALDITANPNPDSVFAARFSLPFCVALALKNGRCGLEDFSETNLRDPDIRSILGRIHLEVDQAIDSRHPAQWGARMAIVTHSNHTYSAIADFPKGDPENPVSDEALLSKFRALARKAWDEPGTETVLERVMRLESAPDTFTLLSP